MFKFGGKDTDGDEIYDKDDVNIKQEVKWYEEEEDIYVRTELELSTPESLELQQALINKSREEAKDDPNMQLIRNYEKTIEKATTLDKFEGANDSYMKIRSDPSKLAQFNTAWDIKSDKNPGGKRSETEGRALYFAWWVNGVDYMRLEKLPEIPK